MANDGRIAVASLVVTGVVAIAAALITWQATEDAGNHATDAARRLADLGELRSLVDQCASDIDSLQKAAGASFRLHRRDPGSQVVVDPGGHRRTVLYARSVSARVKQARQLGAAVTTASFDLGRLRIRVGSSALEKAYLDVIGGFSTVYLVLIDRSSTAAAVETAVGPALGKAEGSIDGFFRAAYLAVGDRIG
jgi:hypothetical protein